MTETADKLPVQWNVIEFMNHTEFRNHPAMYIGEASLDRLVYFLLGYEWGYEHADYELGRPPPYWYLPAFGMWLSMTHHLPPNQSFAWVVLAICTNDEAGVKKFFQLFDSFQDALKDGGIQAIHDAYDRYFLLPHSKKHD